MLRNTTELAYSSDPASPRVWQLARDGQQFGPYTEDELRQMGAAGELFGGDQIWREGLPGWIPAASVIPGVVPTAPAVYEPPQERIVYVHAPRQRPRSAVAAGFGGTIGVIAALIVIPLVLFIGCALMGRNGMSAPPAGTKLKTAFDADDAVAMSKQAVLARLKAPSPASFPDQKFDASKYTDGSWRITGAVDAENSFGAKLRNRFSVVLHETGDGKATVDSVTIHGP